MPSHGSGQLQQNVSYFDQYFDFQLRADANNELSAACNSKHFQSHENVYTIKIVQQQQQLALPP